MPAATIQSYTVGDAGALTGSMSIGLPAGTSAGDLLLAIITTYGAAPTSVTSTGFTVVQAAGGGNVWFAYKVAGAGEAASYTITRSGGSSSAAISAILFRISGADTTAMVDTYSSVQASATTLTLPSITTTKAGLLVSAQFKTGNITPTSTAPAGMTFGGDDSTPANSAAAYAYQTQAVGATGTKAWGSTTNVAGAAGMIQIPDSAVAQGSGTLNIANLLSGTGPSSPGKGGVVVPSTFTMGAANYFSGTMFAISPKNPGWAERSHVPSSLVGARVLAYGTSYCCRVQPGSITGDVGDPGDAVMYNTDAPWCDRVAIELGGPYTNLGIGGSNAEDICCFAYGSHSNATYSTNGNPAAINRAGTYTAQPTPALVLTDLIGNDLILELSPAAQVRDGTALAIEALFRLIRSSAQKNHDDVSIAYAGTWTAPTSDGYMGGAVHQTTAPGSTATITTTQSAIDLLLIAQDDTKAGAAGSTFTVSVNGVTRVTGTVSNRMKATGGGGTTPDYGFVQYPIALEGLTGTSTIVVTHTGTAGQVLQVQGYLHRAATPPWIVTNLTPYFPADAYVGGAGGYFTAQQCADYDQLVRDAAAKFTDGRVIVFDPKWSGLFPANPDAKWFLGDVVHQRDPGHAVYAHDILRLLSERVP